MPCDPCCDGPLHVQPTFVAMYAELCRRLGTELPELAPPAGETQPMSFQRLLLNTCQEEFEGTADARAVRPLNPWTSGCLGFGIRKNSRATRSARHALPALGFSPLGA